MKPYSMYASQNSLVTTKVCLIACSFKHPLALKYLAFLRSQILNNPWNTVQRLVTCDFDVKEKVQKRDRKIIERKKNPTTNLLPLNPPTDLPKVTYDFDEKKLNSKDNKN